MLNRAWPTIRCPPGKSSGVHSLNILLQTKQADAWRSHWISAHPIQIMSETGYIPNQSIGTRSILLILLLLPWMMPNSHVFILALQYIPNNLPLMCFLDWLTMTETSLQLDKYIMTSDSMGNMSFNHSCIHYSSSLTSCLNPTTSWSGRSMILSGWPITLLL